MADLDKMNEPRQLTLSGFIGSKKFKNFLASRFVSQQNIAQPSCDTRNMKDQIINTKISSKPVNTVKNQLESNTAPELSARDDSTPKSHMVHQLAASDKYTIFLEEMNKAHQSTQILFDTLTQLYLAQERVEKIQKEVKEEIKWIKNHNKTHESLGAFEENGISFPIKSMKKFTEYCTLLDKSSEYRQTLVTSIQYTVCKRRSLTKNIASVLRKYLSPELGSQFTAVKSAKSKTVLAKTSFYKHMSNIFLEQSIAGSIGHLSKEEFNKALGEVLWNAKDWKKKKIP